MKKVILIILACIFAAAAGCAGINKDRSRAKWDASGIKSYRMKVGMSVPGHGTPMGTYLITVMDGMAIEIRRNGADEPLPDRKYPINYDNYDTIDDYFNIIGPDDTVRYDSTYGYPTYIRRPDNNRVDTGFEIQVFELTEQ